MFRNLVKKPQSISRLASVQGVPFNQLSEKEKKMAYFSYLNDYSYREYGAYDYAEEAIQERIYRDLYPEFPELDSHVEWDFRQKFFSAKIDRINFTDLLKKPQFAKFKNLAKYINEILMDSSITVSTSFDSGYNSKGNQDYAEKTVSQLFYGIQKLTGQSSAGLKSLVKDFVSEVRNYVIYFLSELKSIVNAEYGHFTSWDFFKDLVGGRRRWLFNPNNGTILLAGD